MKSTTLALITLASLALNASAADPTCEKGIKSEQGDVCCAESCTRCGGPFCELLPGGSNACCAEAIRTSGPLCTDADPGCRLVQKTPPKQGGPDPFCATGVLSAEGDLCCPAECGQCGGAQCAQKEGGFENCCAGAIRYSKRLCTENSAPCITIPDTSAPSNTADADPDCFNGIQNGEFCCPKECGQCGGNGCAAFPGGRKNCCLSSLRAQNTSCGKASAPCLRKALTRPSMCTCAGDPHCTTFDGLKHHFQGKCSYVMTQSCQTKEQALENGDPFFSVTTTNRQCGRGPGATCVNSVSVNVAVANEEVTVTLGPGMAASVNGEAKDLSALPLALPLGEVFLDGSNRQLVFVSSAGAIRVSWDGDTFVGVQVLDGWEDGKLCGLCGNFNGNITDELVTRDGKELSYNIGAVQNYNASDPAGQPAVQEWGNSWWDPSTGDESSEECRAPATCPCCNLPTDLKTSIDNTCAALSDALKDCKETVEGDCVFDLCSACADPNHSDCQEMLDRTIATAGRACAQTVNTPSPLPQISTTTTSTTTTTTTTTTTSVTLPPPKVSRCACWGDPHCLTFDGLKHHFQGFCTYTVAENCRTSEDNPGFSVAATHRKCGKYEGASCVESVVVNLDEPAVAVTLGQGGAVALNGVPIALSSLPLSLGGGVIIDKDAAGRFTQVRVINVDSTLRGLSVGFDGVMAMQVFVPESQKGAMCGLCGNFDGDAMNEFTLKNGTTLAYEREDVEVFDVSAPSGTLATQAFGNSWQITTGVADADDSCRADTSKPLCHGDAALLTFIQEACAEASAPCKSEESSAADLLADCVFDACAQCAKPDAACLASVDAAVQSQAAVCSNGGPGGAITTTTTKAVPPTSQETCLVQCARDCGF